MSLIYTAREVMNYVRNLPQMVTKIYEEFTGIDTRTTALENSAGVDVTTITGDVTINSSKVSTVGTGKITTAKMAIFVSTVQTANGSAQNVAHGLGVSPTTVLVIPVSTLAAATTFSFTKGSTNVVVTGTNTATYMVVAIA